jgi:hypothetical protein
MEGEKWQEQKVWNHLLGEDRQRQLWNRLAAEH